MLTSTNACILHWLFLLKGAYFYYSYVCLVHATWYTILAKKSYYT